MNMRVKAERRGWWEEEGEGGRGTQLCIFVLGDFTNVSHYCSDQLKNLCLL